MQVRVLHGGDELADLELHRLGRVRRPVDEVGEGEGARCGLAQRAQLDLRAEARMDLVAAAHVDGSAGLAELAQLGRGLAHDGRELAAAVAQRELEQRRAVATGARLTGAQEQDLVQILSVGEVAYEHGATVGPSADVTTVHGVSDRTVLVTGGTGGLGAAVTRAFLEDGWRVVVPWVAERELERVEEHERLELVQADLFDPDAAARAVEAAGPSLRALVNLVGGFAIHERVHETPIETYPSRALSSPMGTLGDAHLSLLNVRTELHRVSRKGREMLLAQFADEFGAALHIGDRFDLARVLSDAARTISYYVDAGLRTAANALPRRGFAAFRRPVRRPLDEGVIEFGGEVILARDARPERDPGLILRVAAASATTGLPMAASTLSRLAADGTRVAHAGPRQALKDLLVMLAAGPATVATVEALDRTGAVGQALPGMGRDSRPPAAGCGAHLDRRPPPRRNSVAGKRIHNTGIAPRSPVARSAVP